MLCTPHPTLPHNPHFIPYNCLYTPHAALHPIPGSTIFTGTGTGKECAGLWNDVISQKQFTGSSLAAVAFDGFLKVVLPNVSSLLFLDAVKALADGSIKPREP